VSKTESGARDIQWIPNGNGKRRVGGGKRGKTMYAEGEAYKTQNQKEKTAAKRHPRDCTLNQENSKTPRKKKGFHPYPAEGGAGR